MKKKSLICSILALTFSMLAALPVKAEASDITISSVSEILAAYASGFSEKDYNGVDAAAAVLRGALLNRKTAFSVAVKSETNDANALFSGLLERACKEDFSDPTAGDYLRESISGADASVSYYVMEASDMKYYTFKMNFSYYANAAQENYVTSNVKRIASELRLSAKPEDEKIKAVYDYVTAHVKYDNAAVSGNKPLAHSAYNALAEGKAVCQGYAGLVYRLMREADIPVRIITGKSQGQNHAWNIVKISGQWYNLDATWDSTLSAGNDKKYQYFLKNMAAFIDHQRDAVFESTDFNKAHPMAAGSYSKYQPLITQVSGVKIASASSSALKLTWTKQAKAHGYRVYVYNASDKKYHLQTTVKTNSAVIKQLKPGTGYSFVVRAYRVNYAEGALSAPETFYTNPASTEISSLTTKAKSISVSWKKTVPCAGYQLQYSKNKNFTSSQTKTLYYKKAATVSCKISGLSKGTKYYVRIRPYIVANGKKQPASWSKVKYIQCK